MHALATTFNLRLQGTYMHDLYVTIFISIIHLMQLLIFKCSVAV